MDLKEMKKYLIWLGPAFFLFVSIKEIYIALQYADLAGLNFTQALLTWGSEISVHNDYTGAQLGVILRIDRAIYSLIIFFLFLVLSFKLNTKTLNS